MDDEELVRTVAGKMLEFLGYQAILAKDGEEAVSLYESHRNQGGGFDAVILDWLVPNGMDGFRTLEALLRVDPSAKCILSSGYAEQDAEGQRSMAGFSGVISKPYELKTLQAILDSVLGKPTAV